jgi:uncharacterized protein YbjT (DUF2867 family)
LECNIVTDTIFDRNDLAAAFAGAGFLSVAKRLRQLRDEDAKLFSAILKLLGVDPGDAEFMVRVDRACRKFRVGEDRMAALGWPKLIVLADHISWPNRQELLELAGTVTAKELASILARQSATKRLVLRLTQEQYRVIEESILAHGGARGERDPAELVGKENALVKALSPKQA